MYRAGPLLLLSTLGTRSSASLEVGNPGVEQVQLCSTSGSWAELRGGLQDPLAEAGLAVVPQVVLQVSLLVICNHRG